MTVLFLEFCLHEMFAFEHEVMFDTCFGANEIPGSEAIGWPRIELAL